MNGQVKLIQAVPPYERVHLRNAWEVPHSKLKVNSHFHLKRSLESEIERVQVANQYTLDWAC